MYVLRIVWPIHLCRRRSKNAEQTIGLLLYWYVPVLEGTVSGETLDGIFENGLEVHWLRVDTKVALPRASRQKGGTGPARVVWPDKAGAVGVDVFAVTELEVLGTP